MSTTLTCKYLCDKHELAASILVSRHAQRNLSGFMFLLTIVEAATESTADRLSTPVTRGRTVDQI
jgi:hypothetical protein